MPVFPAFFGTNVMTTAASILLRTLPVALLGCVFSRPACGDDWPQWNGPTRDGILRERGIRSVIPPEGLPKLWSQPIHSGYSGPAVAGGRVYVTDYVRRAGRVANDPGTRDRLEGTERVLCFDARSGRPLWKHAYDRSYAVSYGGGPRATPVIHDGRVYTVGAEGNLICFDAENGTVLWQSDFHQDFQADTPLWGHAATPLIHGDSLICLVGGPGSLVVSFDRRTGTVQWRSLTAEETGYCSPVIVHAGGTEQLMIWDPTTIHSLRPDNGQEYWQHPLRPGYGMSILPPVTSGPFMFVSGEGDASVLLRLDENEPKASVVWTGGPRTSMSLATSGAIFEDGWIYGCDCRAGALVCVRAADGKRMWQTTAPTSGGDRRRGRRYGSAFLIRTENSWLIFSDTGDFISADLSPDGYRETGRFHAIDPGEQIWSDQVVWMYPAISDGRLFLRNNRQLVCYDIRDPRQ